MKFPKKIVEDKHHGRFTSHLIKTTWKAMEPEKPSEPEPVEPEPEPVEPEPEPVEPEPEPVEPEPVEPEPTPPLITCHSTSNYVYFGFAPPRTEDGEWVGWSEDQRYAIKVGDEIFNGDHSLSILGQQFELCGRTFSIPFSSGSTAAIYIDEYTDDTPVKVTFIPSGVSEYDTIYEVNEGYGAVDCDVEYVNKDTEFSVCLKPEKVERLFTCEGATNSLILDYSNSPEASKSMYIVVNGSDTCRYDYDYEKRTQFLYDWDSINDRPIKGWINGVMVNNRLILTVETNIANDAAPYKVVIHNREVEIENGDIVIENDINPTAYYNKNKETIQACILPVPPTVEDVEETPGDDGGSSQTGYHRYRGTHNVILSDVRDDIYAKMNQAIKLAKDDWDEWYSTRTHIPEYKYEATQVSYFRVKWGNGWRYYSNHIRYTKEDPISIYNDLWTWHELIGDGKTYYLVKDEDTLLAEGKSTSDFYPVEPAATFSDLLNNSLASRIRNGILNAIGNWMTEEDTSVSVPNTFHYVAPYYQINPGTVASLGGGLGITATAVTAVARGTVTNPVVGLYRSFSPSISVTAEKLETVPNPYE